MTECSLLHTAPEVKNGTVVWVQNGCDHVADWELWLTAAAQCHERVCTAYC